MEHKKLLYHPKSLKKPSNPLIVLVKFLVEFFTVTCTVKTYGFLIAVGTFYFLVHNELKSNHLETKATIVNTTATSNPKRDSILNMEKEILKELKELKDSLK